MASRSAKKQGNTMFSMQPHPAYLSTLKIFRVGFQRSLDGALT